MRIVVTGATGNVGTSVVAELARRPEVDEVVGLARRRPDWHIDGVAWRNADVRHDDLVDVFTGVDAVVHLGWAFQPSHRPDVTWGVNVHGTTRVLDAAAQARVSAVVVASSVGAYSTGNKTDLVDESWPTHGWSPAAYCREKAYVERLLDGFEQARPEIRVVRMRPAFMFKAPSSPEQKRIFGGRMLPTRLLGRVGVPLVPALPGLVFQVLHTDDAARAFAQGVLGDARGPFNLAADPLVDASVLGEVFGGRPLPVPARPVRELAAAAWHARIVPAPPQLLDYLLQMPLMSCERANHELGWRPERTSVEALSALREGLAHPQELDTPPLAS
ncbi:NAD-dependent epimerase/dehydratase family protein [Nocardioides sp. CER19]|uniref:NAD-dependent epimerase/dehydratase family protein n=1 Tax=Nocardioides sp. CER19 TaxID=3038538 RepID=UPI00244C11F2|nr:NAD-dependent epimerase/dehydratase family protein [Nocardioides sp. CER19]MDH2415021.1 NAD-dependent epimerase/dehydratase family protein [Nocardioides sp. CER19]